ncbi:MAG: mechanosensitive ion channel family protein [Ethanoligenens sp.]|uniref:mechanosensitive ion channel family protein n=1 Tax=Ethanoligenens sp. TaxID=2099655 RepID=UPI0039EC1BC3
MNIWESLEIFGKGLLQIGAVRYLASPLVFLAILIGGWIVAHIWAALGRKLTAAGIGWGQTVVPACVHPLHVFFLVTGIYAALLLFPGFEAHTALLAFFTKLYRSCMIILAAWIFYNLASVPYLQLSAVVKRMDVQSNKAVLPIFSKALRFVIIALAALIVAQEWNFSISGLLAGLGLGGLALSLAAKDMLASLFGGIIILLDKPFKIGDWIEAASIEGTVEDITFRSVKIRTFTQALVTIPNAKVVDSAITNWSRMGKRRVVLKLELDAQTPPAALRIVKNAVLHTVKTHKSVHPETATVSFDDLTGAGVLFSVIYYTRTTKWETFLSIREDILLNILQLLEKHHVPLAVPVQQVHLTREQTEQQRCVPIQKVETDGVKKSLDKPL